MGDDIEELRREIKQIAVQITLLKDKYIPDYKTSILNITLFPPSQKDLENKLAVAKSSPATDLGNGKFIFELKNAVHISDTVITGFKISKPDLKHPFKGSAEIFIKEENWESFKKKYPEEYPINFKILAGTEKDLIQLSDPRFDVSANFTCRTSSSDILRTPPRP
jgi:hypothetical protein